jgi:hypothetical protein
MPTATNRQSHPKRHFASSPKIAFAIGAVALGLCSDARADVVIDWSEALYTSNVQPDLAGAPPTSESRAYAMVHIAMYQAVNLANRTRAPHAASPEAAAAQAAHDVATSVFNTGAFDSLLSSELAAIPDSPAKANGVIIGAGAAADMLAARANDGADLYNVPSFYPDYTPGPNPGDYQFTEGYNFAFAVKWGQVTPFVLTSGSQFRATPPYKVTDLQYTYDLNEIKTLGSLNSSSRTDDQTQLAIFWYESAPLGWNRIARLLVAQHPGNLASNARLFAILNAAIADAGIASFDSKYTYNFWRPITAIRTADTDGNNLTTADPSWEPLLVTPPIPDYPSGHAAFGGAASTVLAAFFGDENTFSYTSTMAQNFPSVQPRTFHRLSEAAYENAISRMMVGIHFRNATTHGYEQGVQVGNWVLNHFQVNAPDK